MKDRYRSRDQFQAIWVLIKSNISSMSGDVLDALLILIPPFILYFKQILLLFATLNYGKGEALSVVEPSFK